MKPQTGCGDAVLLDVWWNVLVMGVRASQLGQVGVGPRVVPPQLYVAQPQFVPVVFDPLLASIYNFQDTQNKTTLEMYFSFHNSGHRTSMHDDKRGHHDAGKGAR